MEQFMDKGNHENSANYAQNRHAHIDKQKHAIKPAYSTTVIAPKGTFLHIEAHIAAVETRREQGKSKNDTIGHLKYAVITLPKIVKEKWYINQVHQIFHQDICISKYGSTFLLTRHEARSFLSPYNAAADQSNNPC